MSIRILVPVKRVVDPNVRVRVSASGAIDTAGLKMSLNPFDECALEKALQLRESGVASHVTVLTCGLPAHQDVLRTALAMGADDAVLIDTGPATPALDSFAVARLVAAHMKDADYGLVLCGKQAIDGDVGGVAAMLAALLGWPQALNAGALDVMERGWRVRCGEDVGTADWQVDGPAVISADLRLAQPRRVTLPSIVKAKQKPLVTLEAAALGVDLSAQSRVVALGEPPGREPGIQVKSVDALLETLAGQRVFETAGA